MCLVLIRKISIASWLRQTPEVSVNTVNNSSGKGYEAAEGSGLSRCVFCLRWDCK